MQTLTIHYLGNYSSIPPFRHFTTISRLPPLAVNPANVRPFPKAALRKAERYQGKK
jgi:hypothetical protein